jgi:hypothetical protein
MSILPLLVEASSVITSMTYKYIPSKNTKKKEHQQQQHQQKERRSGPTRQTHYVSFPTVLAGASVETFEDYSAIRNTGVNVFICLRGEWLAEEYFSHRLMYPSFEEKYNNTTKKNKSEDEDVRLLFIHFPIEDFLPCDDRELVALVDLLETLISVEGMKIYIHCRGGHGRTTIVALPLLAALEQKQEQRLPDSREGVETTTKSKSAIIDGMFDRYADLHSARQHCEYLCQLPETNEQEAQIRRIIQNHFMRAAAAEK